MARVYATVPGAEVWIPPYGTATNDGSCVVPDAVAEELAQAEGLRIEPDDPTMDLKRLFPAPMEAAPIEKE